MSVLHHADIKTHHLPGLVHQTLAGLDNGTYTMEVWRQSLAPRAETPWHRHACEEVIIILAGRGECRMPDRTETFGPETTLIIESDVVHQLVNSGDEPLELLAVLGTTPVAVQQPGGEPLPLPWDAEPVDADLAVTG